MKIISKKIISLFSALSICFLCVITPFSTVSFATSSSSGISLNDLWCDLIYYSLGGDSTNLGTMYDSYVSWCWTGDSDVTSDSSSSSGSSDIVYNFSSYGDTVTTTGTDYSYVYNDTSSTNYYQAIDTTNNTYYNTYTETYNTYNDITYNNEYNTYYITEEYYDVYITNNYTYVTYIVEDTTTLSTYYYEIYYMLPDGRNSYTLSAEDVWGEYFIYDVVNYDYVAEDDGTTLGLWHLDEDVKDSSYWNNTGSSAYYYNYVDGVWDSAFNLGTTDKLTLSLSDVDFDSSSDFTLEFSLYVPSTSDYSYDTTSDGVYNFSVYYRWYYDYLRYIYIDGVYYNLNLTADGYLGNWNKVAIVRNDGIISVYVNGNKVTSSASVITDTEAYWLSDTVFYNIFSTGASITITDTSILFWGKAGYMYEKYTYTSSSASTVSSYYDYRFYSMYNSMIDEVRLSSTALYDSAYTVSSVPYDTNMVMVTPTDVRENTICVQALYDINDVRIGGVRSTYPTTGDVYVYLEDNVVTSVQQYQENAWYTVDATIYADGIYTSLYGYDMSTYEITDPDSDTTTDGDSGTGDGDTTTDPDSDGDGEVSADEASSWFTDIIDSVFSGLFSIIDTILGYVDDLVDAVFGLFDIILGIIDDLFLFGGEFSSFIAVFFAWLPDEIIVLLELSIALPLLFMVIKFFLNIFT